MRQKVANNHVMFYKNTKNQQWHYKYRDDKGEEQHIPITDKELIPFLENNHNRYLRKINTELYNLDHANSLGLLKSFQFDSPEALVSGLDLYLSDEFFLNCKMFLQAYENIRSMPFGEKRNNEISKFHYRNIATLTELYQAIKTKLENNGDITREQQCFLEEFEDYQKRRNYLKESYSCPMNHIPNKEKIMLRKFLKQEKRKKNFSNNRNVFIKTGKKLNGGAFGKTEIWETADGKQYVAKKISLKKDESLRRVNNEIHVSEKADFIVDKSDLIINSQDDSIYLVSEYGGVDLIDIINKYPKAFTERVFTQMLEKVDDLHKSGMIHADLKPENMTIDPHDPNAELLIIDYGFAKDKPTNNMLAYSNSSDGTESYLAPELQTSYGISYTEKSDVYALGKSWSVMLHHTSNIFQKEWRRNPFIQDLIDAMTHQDPNKRPTTQEVRLQLLFNRNYDPKHPEALRPQVEAICAKRNSGDVDAIMYWAKKNDPTLITHKNIALYNKYKPIMESKKTQDLIRDYPQFDNPVFMRILANPQAKKMFHYTVVAAEDSQYYQPHLQQDDIDIIDVSDDSELREYFDYLYTNIDDNKHSKEFIKGLNKEKALYQKAVILYSNNLTAAAKADCLDDESLKRIKSAHVANLKTLAKRLQLKKRNMEKYKLNLIDKIDKSKSGSIVWLLWLLRYRHLAKRYSWKEREKNHSCGNTTPKLVENIENSNHSDQSSTNESRHQHKQDSLSSNASMFKKQHRKPKPPKKEPPAAPKDTKNEKTQNSNIEQSNYKTR